MTSPQETAQNLTPDAALSLRLMPFGGHVRLRPQQVVPEENPFNEPGKPPALSGWLQSITVDPDDIEGFTITAEQVRLFFRASGATRMEARERTTAALTELMLFDLVRLYQDDEEAPRYALTEAGHAVQQVVNAAVA